MITLVLTNRNRDLNIVKKCLDSLETQTNKEFALFLVDYGSQTKYVGELEKLVNQYPKILFIVCPVFGQLWNKSRAINIVLKQCITPYFIVGDIDMIYAPNFIEKLYQKADKNHVIYFQVGFLNQQESQLKKEFNSYAINFKSSYETTGMTLYPTTLLKQINGYDEFYHGWGAEDTDVHIRLRHKRIQVNFYDKEILMLHQWHSKNYRNKDSKEPFHSKLEYINHRYIMMTEKNNIIKANHLFGFGLLPDPALYSQLNFPDKEICVFNEKNEIDAFLAGVLFNLPQEVYNINFMLHPKYLDVKNKIKVVLNKKALYFYNMDEINNMVLLQIVSHLRNQPYQFEYKQQEQKISLKINLIKKI